MCKIRTGNCDGLLLACKYALGVLESIPEIYAEAIADILDESIDVAMIEKAIKDYEEGLDK